MSSLFAITRNTFLETLRQPVYALAMTLTCAIISLMPVTAIHLYTFARTNAVRNAPERMVADLGLATMQLAGLFVAIFVTTSVISREIDQKTVATVLSKPVGRVTFILGKYLGVALGLTALCLTATVSVMLTVRAGSVIDAFTPIDYWVVYGLILAAFSAVSVATAKNYTQGRSWLGQFNIYFLLAMLALFVFFAVVDRDHFFTLAGDYDPKTRLIYAPDATRIMTYDWQILAAAIVTIESVLVIAAVSVCASTRLHAIGNASVTISVFLLGLINQFLQSFFAKQQLGWLTWPLKFFVPDLERFWLSDALVREQFIPAQYLIMTSIYAGLLIVGYLSLACWLFDKRDVS